MVRHLLLACAGSIGAYFDTAEALHKKSRTLSSLCNLCVLCVSVVDQFRAKHTTETQRTQRTQRLHREIQNVGTFSAKPHRDTATLNRLPLKRSPSAVTCVKRFANREIVNEAGAIFLGIVQPTFIFLVLLGILVLVPHLR